MHPSGRAKHRRPPLAAPAGDPPWLVWAVAAGLVLAVAAIYAQCLRFDFLEYDDNFFVRGCPPVRSGLNAASVRWAFTDGPFGEWYPLAMLSHMADCQLFGLNAAGHHLVSVLLHAASSVGLFLVLRGMTARLWPSALVAALFAVHPQHVESVVWIAERRDVLSGLFFVLTLAAYLAYVRRGSIGRYLPVMLGLALGLMSKAMLVTVPAVLLLLDYWPLGRFGQAADLQDAAQPIARKNFGWLVLEKLPLLALVVADAAITVATHAPNRPIAWSARLSAAPVALTTYLAQFFWPVDLAIFYPLPPEGQPFDKVATSLAILLVISAAAIVGRRRFAFGIVGWCWFLGMLLPVIGLVQVADHATADRYMYLPSIGLCIALVWGAAKIGDRSASARRALAAIGVVVIAGLIGLSLRQTSYWRDGETLWNHAIAVSGDTPEAEIGLAETLRVAGRTDEAIEHYRRAAPHAGEPTFFNNFGTALIATGDFEEAIRQLRRGLEINPQFAALYENLGSAQAQQQLFAEAEASFRQAIQYDPSAATPHVSLARVLFKLGRVDEAIAQCRQALELSPDDHDAQRGLDLLLEIKAHPERQ